MAVDLDNAELEEALVTRHVGSRVRLRRQALNLTQEDLARKLNISQQQLHKYEIATNRIAAGRLYLIAQILGCQVSDFFDGIKRPAKR